MGWLWSGVMIAASAVVILNSVRLIVWYFRTKSMYRRWRTLPVLADDRLPKVAVLFSLRGSDPSLAIFLESLLAQDYPNYCVRIAVDTPEDPAWETLRTLESHPQWNRVEVELLDRQNARCSLKNAGIIQLERSLPDDIEYLLILDSDAAIERDAIRKMIVPLIASGADVASGIRWFNAATPGVGAALRYVWNVEATPFLIAKGFPWGGACAIRRSYFVQHKVADRWSRILSDDVCLGSILRETKGKFVCAPLVRCSDEPIGLMNFLRFGGRQMRLAYWYDSHRLLSYSNVVAMGGSIAWLIGGAIHFAFEPLSIWLAVAIVPLLAYGFVSQSVRLGLSREFQPDISIPLTRHLLYSALFNVEQALQGWWYLSAPFRKTVTWRGVTYALHTPFDLEITHIKPMVVTREAQVESVT